MAKPVKQARATGCRLFHRLIFNRASFPRANALGFMLPPALQAEKSFPTSAEFVTSFLLKFMNNQRYEYGTCHVCGEQMTEQMIQQDFWVKRELLVIENVPAGVCPQCGEKVVRADVGQQLALLLANSKRISQSRTLAVPVLNFDAKVA